MLYSDQGNFKLHVVANNPQTPTPGVPRRVILTVNHIEYYDSTPYGRYERPPTEELFRRYPDWKIAGDKRAWRVNHVQQLMKPATKVDRAMVTSFLVILEQTVSDPEKELEIATNVQGDKQHLRRFNNLILDDGV